MKSYRLAAVVFAMLAFALIARAEEEKKDETKPADPSAVIQAGDKDAIAAAMNKDAVVEGTVSRIGASKSGSITFINFKEAKESNFTVILAKEQKEDMDKAFDGDVGKALEGAKIQVKGKIIDYKGKPEIKLEKADQITIIEKAGEGKKEKKE